MRHSRLWSRHRRESPMMGFPIRKSGSYRQTDTGEEGLLPGVPRAAISSR